MKYPSISRSALRQVIIPQLNGGINTKDPASQILDNQLTKCRNMWWYNTDLCTRPGLSHPEHFGFSLPASGGEHGTLSCRNYPVFLNGEPCLASLSWNHTTVQLILLKESGTLSGMITVCTRESVDDSVPCSLYCGNPKADNGTGIFVLVPTTQDEISKGKIFEIVKSGDSYTPYEFTVHSFYIPLISVYGKGEQYSSLPTNEQTETAPSAMFEGFNLLTGAFRSAFTTDGVSYEFRLPVSKLTSRYAEDIRVQFRGAKGEIVTYTISSSADTVVTNNPSEGANALMIKVDRENGTVLFCSSKQLNPDDTVLSNGTYPWRQPKGEILNNLVITAWKTDDKQMDKILGMTISQQFGGADGLFGGSRTFLSGNQKYPNLVCWSAVNNPLYFSESSFAYVGDANQKVTALAKQSDMLVIFKEREIYSTTYVQGEASGEDLLAGRVTDVTAAMAYFPIVQCHGSIGCDLPDTVHLCANRLIWASSDKRVYTLVSVSNTSEENVVPVSSLIENTLPDYDFSKAFAVDWKNHYLLFFGASVLLLDYEKTVYKNIGGYGDSEAAAKNLSWHFWDLSSVTAPGEAASDVSAGILLGAFAGSNTCMILTRSMSVSADGEELNSLYVYTFDFSAPEDDIIVPISGSSSFRHVNYPIESEFATKVFDFEKPDLLKKISFVYLGVSALPDTFVHVTFHTERGDYFTEPRSAFPDEHFDRNSAKILRFLPLLNRIREISVAVKSDRPFSVNSLSLKYKTLGSVK